MNRTYLVKYFTANKEWKVTGPHSAININPYVHTFENETGTGYIANIWADTEEAALLVGMETIQPFIGSNVPIKQVTRKEIKHIITKSRLRQIVIFPK